MKVATILPVSLLNLTCMDDYHMCLAHLVQPSQSIYGDFYRKIGADKDKYLILDNGVIEGDKRPIEEIVKKALWLRADEIILPDVLFDADRTLDEGLKALHYVKDNFPLKVMAVPQGKTLQEWLECAMYMLAWDIDCLGIPKSLISIGGRDARLEVLKDLGKRTRGLDIHLLGCYKTPLEITMIASAESSGLIPKIRGVDSAIAYIYTKAGIQIDEDDRPDITFSFTEDVSAIDKALLYKNITMWQNSAYVEVFQE